MRYFSLYLVSALIVVFVFQQVNPSLTDNFALKSGEVVGKPWTLLTSIFLHSGILHLLYNSFGLALFGSILEGRIGSAKFLWVFMASGLISGIVAAFFYPATIGASGAVFGVIGVLAVIAPMMIVWVSYIPMPMFIAAVVWAVGDVLGLFMPGEIANAAHLAGLAAGALFGIFLRGKAPLKIMKKPGLSKEKIREWEEEYMFGKK
ncbi:rhomboid family intramembrane serine protease [Candidatus Woesearchaeota archaeon]|nr:rhomboid family intramembrane serine protease [Candidatus Woesearchaeota archaeon]